MRRASSKVLRRSPPEFTDGGRRSWIVAPCDLARPGGFVTSVPDVRVSRLRPGAEEGPARARPRMAVRGLDAARPGLRAGDARARVAAVPASRRTQAGPSPTKRRHGRQSSTEPFRLAARVHALVLLRGGSATGSRRSQGPLGSPATVIPPSTYPTSGYFTVIINPRVFPSPDVKDWQRLIDLELRNVLTMEQRSRPQTSSD